MIRVFTAFIFAILFSLNSAQAQQAGGDVVWVQIEAHPSLNVAQQRAQIYADALPDVNGFSLGGNWYGIVLGPYTAADAERVLRAYRNERQIPRDSFIAQSQALGQQYWPVGANILNRGVVAAPVLGNEQVQVAEPVVQPEPSDETPAQARRSERLLSAQERRDLQIALKAAGFYTAAIDGSFGSGTRRSMGEWQLFNGFEQTGILTTAQRKVLMDQYNEPLISTGMRPHSDRSAGIDMDLPLDVVRFSRYEPPFVHFDSAADLGARVLLISQPGDQATLFGLYDIMQTLEIVPLEGPRERKKDSFTLEGRGNGIVSYTEAALKNGEIKGFTLIWPQGDEARRARVLAAMKASFARTDGVLDPGAGADAAQSIDLVSGLQVRRPRVSRSGFFIDGKGTVMTVSEAVDGCTRITLDNDYTADLISADAGLGVAVLRPQQALAPMEVAQLSLEQPRLQSDVTVAGYSFEGVLGAPTLTFGKLSDVKGLRGETELSRLELSAQSGDAGGPVFDPAGSVVGMLLPAAQSGQQLPRGVSFAADAQALRDVLQAAGLRAADANGAQGVSPNELSRRANGMTVLVSCWN